MHSSSSFSAATRVRYHPASCIPQSARSCRDPLANHHLRWPASLQLTASASTRNSRRTADSHMTLRSSAKPASRQKEGWGALRDSRLWLHPPKCMAASNLVDWLEMRLTIVRRKRVSSSFALCATVKHSAATYWPMRGFNKTLADFCCCVISHSC
jgi:hypothetical protein